MKNRRKTNNLILLLAMAMLLLNSCAKEPKIEISGNGEKEVEMIFNAPGVFLRAAIEEEDALKDITLLVFDGNEGTSRFLYSRHAWRTSATANSFKTTLRKGNDLTIYFAANAKDLVNELENAGKLVEQTTTWNEAKELLILNSPTQLGYAGKGLPMWGHKYEVNITNAPNNNLGTVKLLRAVASADIVVEAEGFTLEKVHLVSAPDKGYLSYDPALLSNDRMTEPQAPPGMTTSIDWYKAVTPSDNGVINNYFYMYDNPTPLTSSETNRPTMVMLEGVWNGTGGSGRTTFYPLSFHDVNATGRYVKKQVTRNNKYLIVVTNVNGDGWDFISQAKSASDINVEYDVINWDTNENSQIDIDGSKYFYREANPVVMGHKANSPDSPNIEECKFSTNYSLGDIKMAFDLDAEGVAGTTSNDRFKVETLKVDPDNTASSGDEYTSFRFTALKDYAADTDNPSTLYVTCGRIHFRISVVQTDRIPVSWEDGGNTAWEF